MKTFSFLTNPIFWKAYKRNFIAGLAILLMAIFGFNVVVGNNPLKRGPQNVTAAENVSPGFCEDGWTFNGGDAGVHANWTYTNCGKSGSSGSGSSNSGSWRFVYPECDWSSGQVYDVYWHSGTGEYDRKNYHYQDGVCGYSKSSGSSNSTSSSSNTSSSGSWQFVYPECDWNSKQVYDVYWHSGTGQYDRRNPHKQEGACGYVTEWEGPGCQGNRSVWGVWDNSNRNRLLRVERDYGVVPGECNNPISTPTPYPTQVPQRTYQDRQECDGRRLVVRRYWSDNRTEIVTNYGEYRGYCGVPHHTAPATQAPAPIYSAPSSPTYYVPSTSNPSQPSIPQIQASCTSNATQIFRGSSVTYTAVISTGGTGRLGRVDFRGEQSQSSSSGSFTVPYNTSGAKVMMATVYDADTRGGSQVVQCPTVSVSEPTTTAATTVLPATSYPQPTYQQPVYQQPQQPVYQQPQVVYQQPQGYAYPMPAPNVVYAPVQPTVVSLAPGVNYCPAGHQQQVSGNTVYCLVYTGQAPQTIAYTYSGSGIVSQQVISTGSVPAQPSTPVQQPQVTPTITPSPAGTTIQCPAGYTAQAVGTTVYCVATTQQTQTSTVVSASNNPQQGNVVMAAATTTGNQPKVVTTAGANPSVTELPRTGLPLAAWGVSALLPLGLRMRKNKKLEDDDVSVNAIWLTRQINKE